MDNKETIKEFVSILNDLDFKDIKFRTNDIDFSFSKLTNVYQRLVILLDSLDIAHQTTGLIVNADKNSRDQSKRLYSNYEALFFAVYENPILATSASLIVINKAEAYFFDHTTKKESFSNDSNTDTISWMENYLGYSALLKLFKNSDNLVEFDDKVKNRLMVVDSSKEKNNVIVNYQIFDKRLFSKTVAINLTEIEGRTNDTSKPNNLEWLAIYRHNVVNIISAQEPINKTVTEIFLNLDFILQNTGRDYEIYLSGFSFDKISKEMKEDRQKYFNDLNQAQDKIKSQVIAVPLAVGTSIYAFFALKTSTTTFTFLLLAVAIYIGFIWWYLILYEQDLTKLQSDIDTDSSIFKSNYPTIYKLFESDFNFISKKIRSVRTLSWIIRGVTLLDWILLAIYVIFFLKDTSIQTNSFTPRYVLCY